MKEKDLFLPLKKSFNEQGFKVYPEVASGHRSVDFVAVKGDEQIAVEMKLHFSKGVIYQANMNKPYFPKCYIAIPKMPKESDLKYHWCVSFGIGILYVAPLGTVVEILEASEHIIVGKPYDFSTFEEKDEDEAGLPYQKGTSSAFVVLDRIKKYVIEHPECNWKEIYENVQNHYSSKESLRSSMQTWKGFNLNDWKLPTLNKIDKENI